MKKLFYLGACGMILFEIANVYFIMPMPGSQKMNSIGLAYFLYSWRWIFRVIFLLLIVAGIRTAFKGSKVISIFMLLLTAAVTYVFNFMMAADKMFLQTTHLKMSTANENVVDTGRLILGVVLNGEARAYPIQFLGYHHQVYDSIANKPVIVTYCTVCRTGRVFEPKVNGHYESFRLVGMDHFNAMFEDKTSKSWWRQATGEAIAGKLTGARLPELAATQMTLGLWLKLYPNSLIMQPDISFSRMYEGMKNYESGNSKSNLTRYDSLSWQDKSWIAGIILGNETKAYDWNELKKKRIIEDMLNGQPIVLILAADDKSIVAFKRKSNDQHFNLVSDTLKEQGNAYNLVGKSYEPAHLALEKITVYQEYWHSWRTFHPSTKKY